MSDYKNLQVGDTIKILRVPEGDLRQRENEIANKSEDAGWTANTIEAIIEQCPEVIIDFFMDGIPWYEAQIENSKGEKEIHSISIEDDGTWELVNK